MMKAGASAIERTRWTGAAGFPPITPSRWHSACRRCRIVLDASRPSLPRLLAALQIRNEPVREVDRHAIGAGLDNLLHELFSAHAPGPRDEAFSMKTTHQRRRHRRSPRTELGHAHGARPCDHRVAELSNQPTRR